MPSTEGCRVRGPKPIHLVFLTPTELVLTEGQTIDMGLGHFVYITDITKFSKCYVCPGCTMTFKLQNSYYTHMRKTCTLKNNRQREVFPGKIYRAPESLVEQLFRVGIKTKEEHLYYNMFITFDFECILKPLEGAQGTAKTKVEAQHIPVSVCLCRSEDDIEPIFLSDPYPVVLMKKFVKCLLLMRLMILKVLFQQYKDLFQSLMNKIVEHRF